VIELTVVVNEDSAPPLTMGREILEDILVLHLEKGKDFFITVSGNYLPSCFGSSLDTLVNLHTYIREVPVDRLLDLVREEKIEMISPPKLGSCGWSECVCVCVCVDVLLGRVFAGASSQTSVCCSVTVRIGTSGAACSGHPQGAVCHCGLHREKWNQRGGWALEQRGEREIFEIKW